MIKHYDAQEAVPEAQRAAAIETKDGKWIAEEPPGEDALREAGQRALAAERTARETAERARVKAEADLAEMQRTAQARKEGITEAQLQKIRDDEAAGRKPLEDSISDLTKRNETLAQQNRKLRLTDRVQRLALDNGVMQERIEDAMMHLDRRTDLTEADTIVVLDRAGKPTAESIDHFLAVTFKAEKDFLYRGTSSAGGGMGSGDEGERQERVAPPAPHQQAQRDLVRGAL